MGKRCFYETLGVDRSAKDGELKSAFRKMAMECHPDRNPGDHSAEAQVQGNQRRLRGAERSAEARGL